MRYVKSEKYIPSKYDSFGEIAIFRTTWSKESKTK